MNGLARYLMELKELHWNKSYEEHMRCIEATDALFPNSRETYQYALIDGW